MTKVPENLASLSSLETVSSCFLGLPWSICMGKRRNLSSLSIASYKVQWFKHRFAFDTHAEMYHLHYELLKSGAG